MLSWELVIAVGLLALGLLIAAKPAILLSVVGVLLFVGGAFLTIDGGPLGGWLGSGSVAFGLILLGLGAVVRASDRTADALEQLVANRTSEANERDKVRKAVEAGNVAADRVVAAVEGLKGQVGVAAVPATVQPAGQSVRAGEVASATRADVPSTSKVPARYRNPNNNPL